jgi:hypothetical protein
MGIWFSCLPEKQTGLRFASWTVEPATGVFPTIYTETRESANVFSELHIADVAYTA